MKARNYLAPEYVNTFEVKYGQTASPEGMTGTLMESNVIANDPNRVYNMEINPDKDGNFYIGFHDNTEKAGSGRIVIDFVGIDKGAALDAPDSVSNFTVTPAGLASSLPTSPSLRRLRPSMAHRSHASATSSSSATASR